MMILKRERRLTNMHIWRTIVHCWQTKLRRERQGTGYWVLRRWYWEGEIAEGTLWGRDLDVFASFFMFVILVVRCRRRFVDWWRKLGVLAVGSAGPEKVRVHTNDGLITPEPFWDHALHTCQDQTADQTRWLGEAGNGLGPNCNTIDISSDDITAKLFQRHARSESTIKKGGQSWQVAKTIRPYF